MKKFVAILICLGLTMSLSSCFGPDFLCDGPFGGPHHEMGYDAPHHGGPDFGGPGYGRW